MCLSNIAPHKCVHLHPISAIAIQVCPLIFTLRKIPLKLPRNINKAREGTTTSR